MIFPRASPYARNSARAPSALRPVAFVLSASRSRLASSARSAAADRSRETSSLALPGGRRRAGGRERAWEDGVAVANADDAATSATTGGRAGRGAPRLRGSRGRPTRGRRAAARREGGLRRGMGFYFSEARGAGVRPRYKHAFFGARTSPIISMYGVCRCLRLSREKSPSC